MTVAISDEGTDKTGYCSWWRTHNKSLRSDKYCLNQNQLKKLNLDYLFFSCQQKQITSSLKKQLQIPHFIWTHTFNHFGPLFCRLTCGNILVYKSTDIITISSPQVFRVPQFGLTGFTLCRVPLTATWPAPAWSPQWREVPHFDFCNLQLQLLSFPHCLLSWSSWAHSRCSL